MIGWVSPERPQISRARPPIQEKARCIFREFRAQIARLNKEKGCAEAVMANL
jgi:hypothetical protein